MKKIFILSQWMEIDGVEASLLALLKELDYTKVSVDLFLTLHQGPWMKEIPTQVNLLPPNPTVIRYASSLQVHRQNNDRIAYLLTRFTIYLAAVWYRLICRQKIDEVGFEQIKYAVWASFLPRQLSDNHYDTALIFGGHPGFANRVNANRKIAWIHTDWAHHTPIHALAKRAFRSVDFIVNVSDMAKTNFDRIFPKQKDKSIVIENQLSPRWMRERSQAPLAPLPNTKGLHILSVGRLSAAKNFTRALEAARILKERGLEFLWTIVGDGEEALSLRHTIETLDIKSCVCLAGSTDNTAPYYRWCDLFVCTSDWEGKSVSVREAQIFATPTIITRYPTSASQLEDGVDGVIVDCTPEAVADAIFDLAHNPAKREAISLACKARDYANLREIDRILSF